MTGVCHIATSIAGHKLCGRETAMFSHLWLPGEPVPDGRPPIGRQWCRACQKRAAAENLVVPRARRHQVFIE